MLYHLLLYHLLLNFLWCSNIGYRELLIVYLGVCASGTFTSSECEAEPNLGTLFLLAALMCNGNKTLMESLKHCGTVAPGQ